MFVFAFQKSKFIIGCLLGAAILAGCANAPSGEMDETERTPVSQDIVIEDVGAADDAESDVQGEDDEQTIIDEDDVVVIPDIDTLPFFETFADDTTFDGDADFDGFYDALVFDDSGLVLLPRAFISDDLNNPGVIQGLLFDALGQDFPQAANWTFRTLQNGDSISNALAFFGIYVPDSSPYALIVIGDEDVFINELYDWLYGDVDTATNTYDVISDVVTTTVTGSSVTATGSSD